LSPLENHSINDLNPLYNCLNGHRITLRDLSINHFNPSINLDPVPPSISTPNIPKNLSVNQPINFKGISKNPTIAEEIPALILSIIVPSVPINAVIKSNNPIIAVNGHANLPSPFINPVAKLPNIFDEPITLENILETLENIFIITVNCFPIQEKILATPGIFLINTTIEEAKLNIAENIGLTIFNALNNT
jgi:hypothetical protein